MKAEEMVRKLMSPAAVPWEPLIDSARSFLRGDSYCPKFDENEKRALKPFFTNYDGRVFFVHSLPEAALSVLMAMYSRMKNYRGIRGVFLDSLLPILLAQNLPEVDSEFEGNAEKFLKAKKIRSLRDFIEYSARSGWEFGNFLRSFDISPSYIESFSNSPKIRKFLETYLNIGHKSIMRMGKITLSAENISLLAAKSFEWTRPGSGFIELSTRFVDMSGHNVYPIWNELSRFGVPEINVRKTIGALFDRYRKFQDSGSLKYLAKNWRENYRHLIPDEAEMERGVTGELCDILGNFLPCATLTSVGVAASGEALPQMLKHLVLDATPENLVLTEMIIEESRKIGADQFIRHWEPTAWENYSWNYLSTRQFRKYFPGGTVRPRESAIIRCVIPCRDCTEDALIANHVELNSVLSFQFPDLIEGMKYHLRGEFDKLPYWFESVSAVFSGVMSFRSWRDLQRHGLSTHARTLVTPNLGFYSQEKFATPELRQAQAETWGEGVRIYKEMESSGVFKEMAQYPLAMGNLVGFTFGANLRQLEFCIWQRTKHGVHHEVRQTFQDMEKRLRDAYPWWEGISRANMTPAYIFARTSNGIPLK